MRAKVRRLFFVLNKVDYRTGPERETALASLRRTLHEAGPGEDVPVPCVSAREGLQARISGDPVRWEQNGVRQVESHLVDFPARDKTRLLQDALAHRARDVVSDALMRLNLAITSLRMPLRDLED